MKSSKSNTKIPAVTKIFFEASSDTADQRINRFKLKSDVSIQGIPLTEAFVGYIVLNLYKDYHDCSLVFGFYDDDFAKEIWERLREDKERFAKLPPELEKFKNRPWSGK